MADIADMFFEGAGIEQDIVKVNDAGMYAVRRIRRFWPAETAHDRGGEC